VSGVSRPPLAVRAEGEGSTVCLVPGWSWEMAVWDEIAERLARHHRVVRVDLPGHGDTPPWGPFGLRELAASLREALPRDALWVGWSLGGMAALVAAAHEEGPAALLLVATAPRFVRGDGWPHGVEPAALATMRAALEAEGPEPVLRRFLALQTRGDHEERRLLRRLRLLRRERPLPDPAALACGLAILAEADLRELRPGSPVTWLFGEADPLLGPAVAEGVRALHPRQVVESWAGCAHLPFLSRPEAFVERVRAVAASAGVES